MSDTPENSLEHGTHKFAALQVFHWLVSDRVEYLETTPAGSRLQHFRIVAFMILLLVRSCKQMLTDVAA